MDKSFYKNYFSFENNHWWFRARRGLIFDLVNLYHTSPDNSLVRVFDYGCASGSLVQKMQEAGFAASGGDISEEAVNFGLANGVKNMAVIKDNQIPHGKNNFDFVLALDILEHLPDETVALREIERVLKPGGTAVIFVPAFQFLWGLQDEVSHHYRRYTLPKLLSVVNKFDNLEVVKKTYFNTFLFGPVALVRLLARWFKIKGRESDFDINNRISNFVLHKVFSWECFFLKYASFPFGVSILLVLRKKTDAASI